jgi:molecular chaperone DnaK (HSP70)
MTSCSNQNPTDQMLDKLDDVITEYESKADDGKLSTTQIRKFGNELQKVTKSLEKEYPELKDIKEEDFSSDQKNKLNNLTSRMSDLMGRSVSSPF